MSPCVSPTNVNMFRCSRTSQKGCFLVVFKNEKDNTPSKKKMLVLNLKINWQQPTTVWSTLLQVKVLPRPCESHGKPWTFSSQANLQRCQLSLAVDSFFTGKEQEATSMAQKCPKK